MDNAKPLKFWNNEAQETEKPSLNSLQVRASVLPKISIEYPGEFVVEVMHEGRPVGRAMIQLSHLSYSLIEECKSDMGFWITNLNPMHRHQTIEIDT